MFNYGDIIEYIDGTYDPNFNEAKVWTEVHSTTFKEDLDRRDLPKRYFVIGPEPEPIPEPTIEEQNEAIRAIREQLYIQTSDKLKADYDEAVARGADNVEELKTAWLESKDKIRAENPYIVEEVSAEA